MAKPKQGLSTAHYNGPFSQMAKAAVELDANGWQKPYKIELVDSKGKVVADMRLHSTLELGAYEVRVVDARGEEFRD